MTSFTTIDPNSEEVEVVYADEYNELLDSAEFYWKRAKQWKTLFLILLAIMAIGFLLLGVTERHFQPAPIVTTGHIWTGTGLS